MATYAKNLIEPPVPVKKHKCVPRLYPKRMLPPAEDAATVLDEFIQDASNTPAEIRHLLEEIRAKDCLALEYQQTIAKYDLSLQKHVKLNTCKVTHPKYDAYERAILIEYDKAWELRTSTIEHIDKMWDNYNRMLFRLDTSLAELMAQGIMPEDKDLPSLLKEEPSADDADDPMRPTISLSRPPALNPLHPIPGNASTISALNARLPNPRQPSPNTLATPTSATSATARANFRETSTEATKRRRLNPPTSSGLRQSSLGPGSGTAPKALTPNGIASSGTGGIRADSAGPRSNPTKKAGVKKVAPHQRVGNLNPASGMTLGNGAGLKKGGSLAARRRAMKKGSGLKDWAEGTGTGDEGEFDPEQGARGSSMHALRDSGAGPGQTSAFSEGSGGAGGGQGGSEDEDGEGEGEGEGEGVDTDIYCTCRELSSGNMIGCDGEGCPYEWFHWKCVGITEVPRGAFVCQECRVLGRPLKKEKSK